MDIKLKDPFIVDGRIIHTVIANNGTCEFCTFCTEDGCILPSPYVCKDDVYFIDVTDLI